MVVVLVLNMLTNVTDGGVRCVVASSTPRTPSFTGKVFLASTGLKAAVNATVYKTFVARVNAHCSIFNTFLFLVTDVIFICLHIHVPRSHGRIGVSVLTR